MTKKYTIQIGEIFTEQKARELKEYLELKDQEIDELKKPTKVEFYDGNRPLQKINAQPPQNDIETLKSQIESALSKWECPHCHRIHHISKQTCDCSPPFETATTNGTGKSPL